MDSQTLTHVAAILVGVLVTLVLVSGFSSNSKNIPAATGDAPAAGLSKNQKKKKKKKAKGGAGVEETPKAPVQNSSSAKAASAAPKEAEKKEEEPAAKPAAGKKKKKKAKKPAVNGNATSAANGDSKKENQPKAANTAAPVLVPEEPVLSEWQTVPKEEEWNDVVEPKKKRKNRAKAPKPAATPAAAPAAAPTDTASVTVDAKKIGIIIGPKGATMQAIQAATGCQLDINAPDKEDSKATKAGVVITGPDKESCNKAKQAVTELATKGYARLLQADGFGEFSIQCHPRFLSEIVGPGGKSIQALQKTLDVKITIPSTDWKPNKVQVGKVNMCSVGIAGSKENSKTCKEAIKALMKYHHHEITHPGTIHEEVYVPQEFFHCIIGPRGSEIKHIRGNYKVDIYMPNAESETDNVMVVGKQSNVDKAISYIQLLMDRDTEQREKKYSDEYYGDD